MKCKYCGRPLDPEWQFCKYCGEHYAEKKKQKGAVPAPARRSAAGAPAPQKRSPKSSKAGTAAAQNKWQQLPKWLLPAVVLTAIVLLFASITAIISSMLFGKNGGDPSLEADGEPSVVVTTPPTEETQAETETEEITETLPETTAAALDTESEWAQAYYETLLDFEKEHSDQNPDKGLKYRLLYIDDNEIPEFYLQAREASALYTYVDDEIKCIYDAKFATEEQLAGVRTRRGTYLSKLVTSDSERYVVNTLENGKVSESETYTSEGGTCKVNGATVDLVAYTEIVRAKQSSYQLTDIPLYNKQELLKAMTKAAEGGDLPEMAPKETDIPVPETIEDTDETDSESGEKRFEVFSGTYTWSEAQAKCKEKGGHLAYIKSSEDYQAVKAAIQEVDSDLTYLWVGGKTTIGSDGKVTAQWNDGSSTSYLDSAGLWFGHEPSGKDGDTLEPYMMLWNVGSGWTFNDNSDSCVNIYAAGTMGYVCEFHD